MIKMYTALFVVRAWLEARTNENRERGATMIEYGLLAGLISIAALVAIRAIGPALQDIFQEVADAL